MDRFSLLIGLLAGVVLGVALMLLRPQFQAGWRWLRGWVSRRLAWLKSGAELRYLAETAVYANQHHLGYPWADLEQVFVPPWLTIPAPEFDPYSRHEWGADNLHDLWPELAAHLALPFPRLLTVRELLTNGRRVLVAAPDGAGKSTLLAHCAWRCTQAQAEGPDAFLHGRLPVLVHVAELDFTGGLADVAVLTAALQKRCGALAGKDMAGLLAQKFNQGRVLLLLDGWDQCDPDGRTAVFHWLRDLLQHFPRIRVIVVTAPSGYGPLLSLDFVRAGILPWRSGQVEQLIDHWLQLLNVGRRIRLDAVWRAGQTVLETSLRIWLNAAGEGQGKRLSGMNDLLGQALLLLAANPRDGKRGYFNKTAVNPDPAVLAVWQRAAYVLVDQSKLSLTPADLETAVPDADNVLLSTCWNQRFFMLWGKDNFGFVNHLWRDFLAAQYLLHGERPFDMQLLLPELTWGGVFRFYVAEAGAAELADGLLGKKDTSLTRHDLFQVASWLAEAAGEGEWRRQTLVLLGQIIRQVTFPEVLRLRAVAALVQTGEPGVYRFLQQLIERSDPFLRQAGTAALPYLGADRSLDDLVNLLQDKDERVRITAVYGLLNLNHPDAEQPLLNVLVGEDEKMSWAVARGLALGGANDMEILKEALDDEDFRVRRAAVQGLKLVDESWVNSLLVRAEREDGEWIVRSAAGLALEERRERRKPAPWPAARPENQTWLADYAEMDGRPLPYGAAAQPYLVRILTESQRPVMRMAAAATLGQIAAQGAVPALETASQDDDREVREAAFATLYLLYRAFPEERN